MRPIKISTTRGTFVKLCSRRNLYIVASFFLAALAFTWWELRPVSSNPFADRGSDVHHVNETEDGFSPRELTIKVGDSVKFTTTRGKPFWPASDLHPSHTIYPQFDPKQPTESTNSWTFRFDKIGQWNYHDHLAPDLIGAIIVKENITSADIKITGTCSGTKESPPLECWNNLMKSTVKQYGAKGAFAVMKKLYQSDPLFPGNCHTFAHLVGFAVYESFAKNETIDLDLGSDTSWCSYGFFHGFTERLFREGKNTVVLAKKFCDFVDQKLEKQATQASENCYHGIGHGTVVDPPTSLWGNPQGVASFALKTCRDIHPSTQKNLDNCYIGSFNGLSNLYLFKQFNFDSDKLSNDPYRICRDLPEDIRNFCYPGFTWLNRETHHQDFTTSVRFVEEIGPDDNARQAMRVLAYNQGFFYGLRKPDFHEHLDNCRSIQTRLHRDCIQGYVVGLINGGEPGMEEKWALTYCHSTTMTESERGDCYISLFYETKKLPAQERIQQICSSVEEKYRDNSCSGALHAT